MNFRANGKESNKIQLKTVDTVGILMLLFRNYSNKYSGPVRTPRCLCRSHTFASFFHCTNTLIRESHTLKQIQYENENKDENAT